jgi:hypothetical protein
MVGDWNPATGSTTRRIDSCNYKKHMKIRTMLIMSSLTFFVANFVLLFQIDRVKSCKPMDVSMWMKYDDVLKVFPQQRKKLERAGIVVDRLDPESNKYLPLYRLDLEKEHGIVLTFNPHFELISIYRISRASPNAFSESR